MLNLTQATRDALQDDTSDSVVIIDLLWPTSAGGPQFFTDNPFEITIGSNTYSPSTGLLAVSTPQATTLVDRDSFNLTLSDNGNVFNSRVEQASTGVEIIIRILLKQNGEFLTESLPVYRGISSGAAISTNDSSGRVLALEFTSPLTKLTQVNSRLTTDAEQRAALSTDSSMIHVADSINEASVKWGRV